MRQFNVLRGTKGFITAWNDMIRFRYMITEQAKERVRILAFWEKHGNEATKEAFSISRRTLFRWQKALKNGVGKLEALNPGNKAPQRKRRRTISASIKECILAFRREHPRLGKDKVHALLKNEGYGGSISTVGRIIGDLKKQGILPKHIKLTVSARTGKLIEKVYKPRKKLRRPKGHRVLEADTIVRFIDGTKRYILTGIDTEKRTAFAGAYTNHGSKSASDFLRKTRIVLPLCPDDVQTDNGSEFALHFHTAVKEAGLHFNTHPRSPKENAHVERFNRTLDEEFLRYHRALLRDDISAFNKKLVDWLLWYNGERPHHALGLKSPFQAMMTTLPAEECQMWWTDTIPRPNANIALQ